MMKIKLVSIVLLLGSCSMGKAEFDKSPDLGESVASNIRDLGWVVYATGRWTEASALEGPGRSVVQLGMHRKFACAKDHVCFDAPLVTELVEDGSSPCPTALGAFESQHAVGRFSGVIVCRDKKSTLVTAKHARGLRGYVALRSHDLANANIWLVSDPRTLTVPKGFVTEVETGSRCDRNLDLMLGNLAGDQGGVKLVDADVGPGTVVQAFGHPFGLPMKMAEATITTCDDVSCWIEVEMSVASSGSPVFTQAGELAGILVGTGLEKRTGDAIDHGHPGHADLHPCCCSKACAGESAAGCWDGCKRGQSFIKASVIARMMDNGGGDPCGPGGWLSQ